MNECRFFELLLWIAHQRRATLIRARDRFTAGKNPPATLPWRSWPGSCPTISGA
jgi:hypothetical protein